jgi:hypothetical protein
MNPSMAESSDDPQDLSRTLFSRLSAAGLEPILVRSCLFFWLCCYIAGRNQVVWCLIAVETTVPMPSCNRIFGF